MTTLPPAEQQVLQTLLDRIPARWTAEQRRRWCVAFEATLDLLVEVALEEPSAHGTPATAQQPATVPLEEDDPSCTAEADAPIVIARPTAAAMTFTCDQCEREFPTLKQLLAHQRNHEPWTCWCGYETTALGRLSHEANHRRRGQQPPDTPDAPPAAVVAPITRTGPIDHDAARRRAAEAI